MLTAIALVASAGIAVAVAVAEPPVPYPHPLVTELLYAVPSGDKGDASDDGVRDAVGDEFVELINPHDRPIQLKGYTITDGTPADPLDPSRPGPGAKRTSEPSEADRKQVRFTFPAIELEPGEVVVVFNGYKQRLAPPVGDTARAPSGPNEKFSGAWVFSMKNDSQYIAFANTADSMILWDPDGKPVQAIHWRQNVRAGRNTDPDAAGRPAPNNSKNAPKQAAPGPASDRAVPPPGTLLVEKAPETRGSVARIGRTKTLVAHADLPGLRGEPFSPGRVDPASTDDGGGTTAKPPPR